MLKGLLGAPRNRPKRPVAIGFPPGYPLGQSANEEDYPDIDEGTYTEIGTGSAATVQAISLPTDISPGDCFVGYCKASDAAALPAPDTGWFKHSASFNEHAWFWKICDGTEGSTMNVTMAVAAGIASVVHAVSKQDAYPIVSGRLNNSSAPLLAPAVDQADYLGRPGLLLVLGSSTGTPAPWPNYTMTLTTVSFSTGKLFTSQRKQPISSSLPQIQTTTTSSWSSVRFCFMSRRPGGLIPRGAVGWDEHGEMVAP